MSKNRVSESFMRAIMQVRGLAPAEEPVAIVEQVVEEEQIDELSKKTLGSYVKKAVRDVDMESWNAGRFGERGVPKAKESRQKANRRRNGISMAAGKLAKEESEYEYMFVDNNGAIVEAIDMDFDSVKLMFDEGIESIPTDEIIVEDFDELQEVSQETLKSYQKKAQASIDATKKKGKPSKAVVAIRAKRGMGMERAKEKLQAIYNKESEARIAKAKIANDDVDNHFDNNHHDIMTKHGFKLLSSGKHDDSHVKTYAHAHDNGNVSLVSVHKKTDEAHETRGLSHGYRHEIKAVNSKGTSWGSHCPNKGIWDPEKAQAHKNEMMPEFEAHVIRVKKEGASEGRW